MRGRNPFRKKRGQPAQCGEGSGAWQGSEVPGMQKEVGSQGIYGWGGVGGDDVARGGWHQFMISEVEEFGINPIGRGESIGVTCPHMVCVPPRSQTPLKEYLGKFLPPEPVPHCGCVSCHSHSSWNCHCCWSLTTKLPVP